MKPFARCFQALTVSNEAGREGGARVASELIQDRLLIHNYGAGGTGFQASWYSPTFLKPRLPCADI